MRKTNLYKTFLILLFIFVVFHFPGCTAEPVETDLLIPVNFSNVPENLVLTNFHTDKLEIRILAHPRLIELINKKDIHYPVDLYTDLEFDPAGDSDSIEPGSYLFPVEEKRIPMDRGITILTITPPYLSVQLEKKIKKTFKITVPYIGKPAKGHIALDAATEPAVVELIGASTLIQSIKELKTKPIDITNVSESFKKEIPSYVFHLSNEMLCGKRHGGILPIWIIDIRWNFLKSNMKKLIPIAKRRILCGLHLVGM